MAMLTPRVSTPDSCRRGARPTTTTTTTQKSPSAGAQNTAAAKAAILAKVLPGASRHGHGHPLRRVRARASASCGRCRKPIHHDQWMWACPSCPGARFCAVCGARQPPAEVRVWLDGEDETGDGEVRRRQAAAASGWLGAAVIAAHADPSIKDVARQLLVLRDFTGNLEVLRCLDLLRGTMKAELERLGEPLAREFVEDRLGARLSAAAVSAAVAMHPTLAKAGVCQGDVLPFDDPGVFDYSGAPWDNPEQVALHCILLTAVALDDAYQATVLEMARELGMGQHPEYQRAAPKSFPRANNKTTGDYRDSARPRAQFNVDVIRCLCVPSTPEVLLAFLSALTTRLGGAVKLKNFYAADEASRAARFHLASAMVTVVYDSGATHGELCGRPDVQAKWDAYAAHPKGQPPERWSRDVARARAYLGSPRMASVPAKILAEVQCVLPRACEVRHTMHELYKVFRNESGVSMLFDFESAALVPWATDHRGLLFNACRMGLRDVAAGLLDAAGGKASQAANTPRPGTGTTPLSTACENGHVDVVEMLLRRGADANQADGAGFTPLTVACQFGHADVVRLLLGRGAAVGHARGNGTSPLHTAAMVGHTDVVGLLLDGGARIDAPRADGATPLLLASVKNHPGVAAMLLARGASVGQMMGDSATPLFMACSLGHAGVAERLLAAGADVDQPYNDGSTPLLMASTYGHLAVVKLLLGFAAAVDTANASRSAAVLGAAEEGHLEVVKLLVGAGADVHHADGDGDTALGMAIRNRHSAVEAVLRGAGATC